jgi:hypothetical protein
MLFIFGCACHSAQVKASHAPGTKVQDGVSVWDSEFMLLSGRIATERW